MILSLLFSFFVSAAPEMGSEYPTWEEPINAVMALFNQQELAPEYIKNKLKATVNERRSAIRAYERFHRDQLNQKQKLERAEFDKKFQEENKAWRVANPKGDLRGHSKEMSDKRRAFLDGLTKTRKEKEEFFRGNSKKFEEFVQIRNQEFSKKMDAYKKAFDEKQKNKAAAPGQDSKALKEFESIPKGEGSPLSPAKSE